MQDCCGGWHPAGFACRTRLVFDDSDNPVHNMLVWICPVVARCLTTQGRPSLPVQQAQHVSLRFHVPQWETASASRAFHRLYHLHCAGGQQGTEPDRPELDCLGATLSRTVTHSSQLAMPTNSSPSECQNGTKVFPASSRTRSFCCIHSLKANNCLQRTGTHLTYNA